MSTAADYWVESNDVYGYLHQYPRIPGLRVSRLSDGGMEMSVIVKGTIKGTSTEKEIALDSFGHQFNAPAFPPFYETQRRTDGWTVQTATLFAPLVAVPTTTAALEIYNNSSSRLMVISELFADQILSTAATQTYAIYAMVSTQKAIPTLTALTLASLSGKALITPTATSEAVTGVGTTVIANGWRPWGPPQAWGTAAATPGNAWSVPVDGKMVIPSGCSLCLHVVGSLATASTFQVGASFDWVTAEVVA